MLRQTQQGEGETMLRLHKHEHKQRPLQHTGPQLQEPAHAAHQQAQKLPDTQVPPKSCLCIQPNSQVVAELAPPLAAMLTVLCSHTSWQLIINEGGLLLDGNVMPPFGPFIFLVPIWCDGCAACVLLV